MKTSYAGVILLLFSIGKGGVHAQPIARGEVRFMWYNVENLFHPDDDASQGDDEFTPGGLRNWTWSRYRKKLSALSKVIIASGMGEPPELLGLCEVENALVLEDLIAHPILSPYNYSYFHMDSRDHRGMDVACLIRMNRIASVQWEAIQFASPLSETRDMLHLSLTWGGDTLDLFLVHLLSKYGGAGATASLRSSQAEQLLACMDSVYLSRQHGWIMAAGDFNETYEGFAMHAIRQARFGGDSLTVLLPEEGPGTYKFRGMWISIDQVLVLQSMPVSVVSVSSLDLPPLLTEDLKYGGIKPLRCYEGMQYTGGISDHLPLLIDLNPSLLSVPAEQ